MKSKQRFGSSTIPDPRTGSKHKSIVRREALSGPESLTPSELRVAELAAAGHSNRDIAQTLYVTPKTVEVHLTSIYRKLGISTRATLADALAYDAA